MAITAIMHCMLSTVRRSEKEVLTVVAALLNLRFTQSVRQQVGDSLAIRSEVANQTMMPAILMVRTELLCIFR